ncbi:MAG: nuclear transport factor 2 family protein [Planctomycetota bacterium]|nr:nuclear transport factor 2 family protein [Planctomycetota bacterium]
MTSYGVFLKKCLSVGVILVTAGCWSSAPPSPSATWSVQSQALRAEGQVQIRHLLRALEVAESEADMEALEALYAPDASWLPPEGPLTEGREGILAQYESMFAEMEEVRLLLSAESIGVTATTGQVLGWAGLTLIPRSGGGEGEQIYRFRLVLQRNAEGVWQIRFLQWWPWVNLEDGPETLPEGVLPSGEPETEDSARSPALGNGGWAERTRALDPLVSDRERESRRLASDQGRSVRLRRYTARPLSRTVQDLVALPS